jgi:hypothetical protein
MTLPPKYVPPEVRSGTPGKPDASIPRKCHQEGNFCIDRVAPKKGENYDKKWKKTSDSILCPEEGSTG